MTTREVFTLKEFNDLLTENSILKENLKLTELDLREAQEQLNHIKNSAHNFLQSLGISL